MIRLRDKVKDTLTDFRGTCVGRVVYLNGCVRCEVQARELKDGKPIESVWIDEGQLICTKSMKEQNEKELTGGPRSRPSGFSRPA